METLWNLFSYLRPTWSTFATNMSDPGEGCSGSFRGIPADISDAGESYSFPEADACSWVEQEVEIKEVPAGGESSEMFNSWVAVEVEIGPDGETHSKTDIVMRDMSNAKKGSHRKVFADPREGCSSRGMARKKQKVRQRLALPGLTYRQSKHNLKLMIDTGEVAPSYNDVLILNTTEQDWARKEVKFEREEVEEMFSFCVYKPQLARLGWKKFRKPLPRSGHRIVFSEDDNSVYCFGGYTADQNFNSRERNDVIWISTSGLLFKELWKFNLASRMWVKLKQAGRIPEELASHSVVLKGKDLIVFGGTGLPFGSSRSNNIHTINLKDLTWKTLPNDGDPPEMMYGQAVYLDGDQLYVVGGTTGFVYSINVHRFDLNTRKWTQLEAAGPQPDARYRHEIIVDKGKIYVFGGGTNTVCFPFNQIPVYDIERSKWNNLGVTEQAPAPRRCHGCVKFEDKVYICGGFDGKEIFSDIWSYSLETFDWTKLPFALPKPVYFHSVAVTKEGQMCIFGGVDSLIDNSRTSEMYTVWLKIPSLAEIAWQSILHYEPGIAHTIPRCLYAEGVPPKYIEKILFYVNPKKTVTVTE